MNKDEIEKEINNILEGVNKDIDNTYDKHISKYIKEINNEKDIGDIKNLERYKNISLIGKGTFGSVFTIDNEKVIKIIRPNNEYYDNNDIHKGILIHWYL